ncbi:MAG: DNA-3-methyladenine glycosylase I [Clostridia bacterium]
MKEQETFERCGWTTGQPDIYLEYHDKEWGVPVHDDRLLFQKLVLDGAQAGLSWLTILKKQQNYIYAFDGFDIEKVASYDDDKVLELISDPGIVRNRLKIESAIKNARTVLRIRDEFGSFDNYLWRFIDFKTIQNNFASMREIPVKTEMSDRISMDMRKRGMGFVGSTIIYAYMQAIGMVNDHTLNCFRHRVLAGD